MSALVRVDSSLRIGVGHLMRCLTLANELRREGVQVTFACRALAKNMNSLIEGKGFSLHALPNEDRRDQVEAIMPDWEQDAAATMEILNGLGTVDWLIVDHYGLDYRWERKFRSHAHRIMAIDDLANRKHECDLLLDQNFYHDAETRYSGLIPDSTRTMLGPRYALLRSEFEMFRRQAGVRNGPVKRILIFFGGMDSANVTAKAIHAVRSIAKPDLEFDVVVGGSNPHSAEIEQICREDARFHYHCQAENMAELMARADLALGAGGATTWERCYLGLPTITLATAANQISTNQDLAANGICWFLGRAQNVEAARLREWVVAVVGNPEALRTISAGAMSVTGEDDSLPSRRVVKLMLADLHGSTPG